MPSFAFLRAAASIAGVLILAASPSQAAPSSSSAPAPKLIVVISVDQFAAGLFGQWRTRFTGGLARLGQGIVYPNGYQSHAATETCPGHSTLLTGKRPNKTGIVGNDYRDPETGKQIYCLEDASATRAEGGDAPAVGPGRLMATTLADWLKAAAPESRVVAVAGKDRAAINMAGHNPDAVFWLQPGFGFTTYLKPGETAAAKLAPLAALNARIAGTWARRPAWRYRRADCRALAARWRIGDAAWESTLPPDGWGVSSEAQAIAADVMASPINDDLTGEAARVLIDRYRLGRGASVDLLAIGFSATDTIGHRFGSDGPEMCEQLHRLDATIGSVLAKLDAAKISYLVALSADHGGSDFGERLRAKGYDAKVADGRAILERANRAVMAQFNLTRPPLSGSADEVYVAAPAGVDRARLEAAAAAALAADPDVAGAFTQAELLATPVARGASPETLTLRERFAASTYPGRSPDVSAALKPLTTARAPRPGLYLAGHGSPWDYDRRVPILFWWPGAVPQERPLAIETTDIAPSLAAVLGLTPPADIDGRCRPLGADRCPVDPR